MTIDFLIIGGGIAGMAAASALAPLGKVVILEAEQAMGYHASGRSAAMYEKGYGNGPVKALSELGEEPYLTRYAGVLSPRGFMVLGKAGQEADFERVATDLGAHAITVDDALARVPVLNADVVAMAAYEDGARDLDTDFLLTAMWREARQHGAEIRFHARVSEIVHDGLWRVTAGEVYEARHLVNAAGAWADQVAVLAGIAPIGLQPYRRSMARVPAPDALDVTGWPMMYSAEENWYAKPDAGGMLISPCEEDPSEPCDAWADDMVLAHGIANYQEFVVPEVTRVLANWAGLRSFVPDRSLVLGPEPGQPDFIWCAAQGGYGFQTAAGVAQVLGDMVSGTAPVLDADIMAALVPDRLR